MWVNVLIAGFIAVFAYGLTLYLDHDNSGMQNTVPVVIDAPVTPVVAQNAHSVPAFSFTDRQGATYSIEDFKGKIILLNFWASWCPPCVYEFPALLKIAARHKKDVVLIALSSDTDEAAMERFVAKLSATPGVEIGKNVFIALDKQNMITQALFEIYRLPETLIIDPRQKLRSKLVGADWTIADAEALIDEARREEE